MLPPKEHFKCENCEYISSDPIPRCKRTESATLTSNKNWCGKGKWVIWSDLHREFLPYYWGEWHREKPEKVYSWDKEMRVPKDVEAPPLVLRGSCFTTSMTE